MKFFFRIGVLAIFLFAPAIAVADDFGWYLDGGLGISHSSEPAPLIPKEAPFTHYSSSTGDQDSTVLGLGGGYWLSPDTGLQSEYLDLGQFTHLARGRTFFDCPLCGSYGFVESSKAKVKGLRLSITRRYSFADDLELVGRLGLFVNQVSYYDVTNFGVPSFQKYPGNRIDVAPELGLSVGWKLDAHWEALVGLDDYFDVGDSKYGQFNVTALTLDVQYHF